MKTWDKYRDLIRETVTAFLDGFRRGRFETELRELYNELRARPEDDPLRRLLIGLKKENR